MAATTLVDPRTELVRAAADEVCHIFCLDCMDPSGPMFCGAYDPRPVCPADCTHPECPMCVMEWERHCLSIHGGCDD